MDPIEINPNVANFIKSLRDIGYTFEVAVADIIDNSISAGANDIKIYAIQHPEPFFCILDNGAGMDEDELIEAMRLSSKNPDEKRNDIALGKFGLGLKTASFSQCKKLTVVSKKCNQINIKQWDLDYISKSDKWLLLTPELSEYKNLEIFKDFYKNDNSTLVVWEDMDKIEQISECLEPLREHLSLVFHQFLEGADGARKIKISINNNPLIPFNPFNPTHDATFMKSTEIIKYNEKEIKITPFILPHHSKVTLLEWEKYSGREGYIKSQGFYLYRAHRLLVYGKWWGILKSSDTTKLVRIKIELSNDQDELWNIDVKKSIANPVAGLKEELKRVALYSIKDGVKPFSTRGRKINDKNIIRFWDLVCEDSKIYFAINKENPIHQKLLDLLDLQTRELFQLYLKSLEACMPLEAIQVQVQQKPHNFRQEDIISNTEVVKILEHLKNIGLSEDEIKKIEIFKKHKEPLDGM